VTQRASGAIRTRGGGGGGGGGRKVLFAVGCPNPAVVRAAITNLARMLAPMGSPLERVLSYLVLLFLLFRQAS
jgi:hypothetical protein